MDKADFDNLSDKKKLTVCQRLKEDNNIISVSTLQTEFKIISSQVAAEKDSSGSGSSGGSGGKKRDVTIGGGIGGGNTPGTVQPSDDIFSDINGVSWAKGYIVSLANRGILSGKGDGKFYPGESMLREEFAKVIAVGSKIDITSGNTEFTDVTDSAWYAPYLAACVNANIINGIGDGKFRHRRNNHQGGCRRYDCPCAESCRD